MSRQITYDSVAAFVEGRKFKRANMEVALYQGSVVLLLHGNAIATRNRGTVNSTLISNAGWFSNTTKDRLDAVLHSLSDWSLHSEKGEWILSTRSHGESKRWDGEWLAIADLNNLSHDIAEERTQATKRRICVGGSVTYVRSTKAHADATVSRFERLFPDAKCYTIAGWNEE